MIPVYYMPAAEKYFRKLKDKKLKNMFRNAVMSIRKNPMIGDAKTGDLKGLYCLDLYYNKTNYELAYRISKTVTGEIIIIIIAGTRENFYQEVKRYMDKA